MQASSALTLHEKSITTLLDHLLQLFKSEKQENNPMKGSDTVRKCQIALFRNKRQRHAKDSINETSVELANSLMSGTSTLEPETSERIETQLIHRTQEPKSVLPLSASPQAFT